ncbi:ribosome maturation factor RimP [Seinonella peptonophila]|uniref:Ribosome maturation factor RimP n=1 Tax=Seinonella peptonophila TaxID=112248 RepID=A0A1M5APN6_9BACL|nr:ribosome maturation factor RimP [Seinonella peptonophila]SHF32126.1 ribosome maturation factor RimP [Seinonella peptonophila]
MSRQVIEIVEKIAKPIVKEEGLELFDIEYSKEGANWFLRVFIDLPGGAVNLDHCSKVSEKLSKELDRVDPIPTAYMLEVSSPGAERPLKREHDFQRAIGKYVYLSTYAPVKGEKEFTGTLKSVEQESLVVEVEGERYQIPRSQIAKARLAILL